MTVLSFVHEYKPANLDDFVSWSNWSSASYIAFKCIIIVTTHIYDAICQKMVWLITPARSERPEKTLSIPPANICFVDEAP